MPIRSTEQAGAWDIHMPEAGSVAGEAVKIDLGFKAAVPQGHVALLLPRSGVGAKHGLELNNTCGVIDSDYRGNWLAFLRTKTGLPFSWAQSERVLQFLVVPVYLLPLEQVDSLDETGRGAFGFGSTGR